MKQQLRAQWRLILLSGVALGLAAIYFVTVSSDPLRYKKKPEDIQPVTQTPQVVQSKPWEFPGGGRVLLPQHRLVALYGHPDTRALGSLGEQPMAETIARIKQLSEQYQQHSTEKIYPALEIITTIAAAEPTSDGNYSRETPVDKLRPWVDTAKQEGVYIVLDLQPGLTDFLAQAKIYEELLREPHVGLALDPEWRLKPGQKHMKQIGSVSAAEINQTAAWLADLTKQYELPQKLLLLHQFKLSMISERETLDTSRPELAWSIQMDGLGAQQVKQATWNNVRAGAQTTIHFGWKNFIDEDKPMLAPDQTMQILPKPYFISYQ